MKTELRRLRQQCRLREGYIGSLAAEITGLQERVAVAEDHRDVIRQECDARISAAEANLQEERRLHNELKDRFNRSQSERDTYVDQIRAQCATLVLQRSNLQRHLGAVVAQFAGFPDDLQRVMDAIRGR